jgi:hypothetical protein
LQSAGPCCEITAIVGQNACFGGTDAQPICEDFGLPFEANALCDNTGSPPCQAP